MPNTSLVQKAKNNSILIAKYMIEQATIDGKHFAYNDGEKMLYCFDGRIYVPYEGLDLDKFFHEFLTQYDVSDLWKSSRLSEFERAIKVDSLVPRVEMDNDEKRICFKNGVLNMETMVLENHSSANYFTTFVDVDYNPEAGDEPEEFITAMQKIFFDAKKNKPDEITMEVIRCIGGALIFPKNKLRQLTIFLGGGSNGKSIIMNVFGMFFSKDHTTYLSLEELSTKNLERSRLLKSRINFCKEQKGGHIDSEEIKTIVYGEGVTIRRKNKEAVEFIPRTKIVVSANSRPYFNDSSYGLERRLTIVSFDNLFLKPLKYKKYINPEKQGVFLAEDDDKLMDKLRKERSQILNYFIVGLKKLIKAEWELPESMATKEIKEDYLEANDTIGTWLKDNYEVDGTGTSRILVTNILAKYRIWYNDNVSTKAMSYATSTLGVKISEIFRIKAVRKSHLGRRLTAYPITEINDTSKNTSKGVSVPSEPVVGADSQNGFPELDD